MGEDKPGIDLGTLKRVIEEGKQCYTEGMSYARWYDEMIMENGTYSRPYLREAWKHIKHGTCPDPQPLASASRLVDGGRFRNFIAAQEPDQKAFLLGAVCGIALCLVLCILFGLALGIGSSRQSRFILVHGEGVWVYKMDTRTGQTWLLNRNTASPVESPTR